METKDLLLIIIAILGWLFGVVQFFVNRRTQKKDKLITRKYEAYSNYMKKIDEIMNSVRDDPSLIYNIYTDFVKITLSGDSK